MNIIVRQKGITDCGIAALLSICNFFGIKTSYTSIRRNIKLNFFTGVSMQDIIINAEKSGLSANGILCSWQEIQILPTPLIARIVYLKFIPHYIVIYEITDKKLTIMNPDLGRLITYSSWWFNFLWSGYVITFCKTSN